MANPKGRPQNLKPWKPGQSGNPGGRPQKRPITEGYEQFANEKLPEDVCKKLGLKAGSTYAQGAARAQFIKALQGETKAVAEIREAIEGKATQRIEIDGDQRMTLAGDPGAPLKVNLKTLTDDELKVYESIIRKATAADDRGNRKPVGNAQADSVHKEDQA